jgi:hypothetical protein
MAFRVLILSIIFCSQSYPATAGQVLDYSSLNAFLYSIRALAIWRGDEYILNFLFANQLQFQPTNNAKQLNNNELLFINLAAVTG